MKYVMFAQTNLLSIEANFHLYPYLYSNIRSVSVFVSEYAPFFVFIFVFLNEAISVFVSYSYEYGRPDF